MARNEFMDPVVGGIGTYQWHVNHLEQEGPARENSVSFEGSSDGQGVVGTEGDLSPLLMRLSGRIIHKQQNIQFWAFRHLTNSFRFTDWEGNQYEVKMTSYAPTKIRVAKNHSDPTMEHYIINYQMELWILRVIAGDLLGVPA